MIFIDYLFQFNPKKNKDLSYERLNKLNEELRRISKEYGVSFELKQEPKRKKDENNI